MKAQLRSMKKNSHQTSKKESLLRVEREKKDYTRMSLIHFKKKQDILDVVQLLVQSLKLEALQDVLVAKAKEVLDAQKGSGNPVPGQAVTEALILVMEAHHVRVLQAQGHPPEAIQDIKRAAQVFPGDQQVRATIISLCDKEESFIAHVQQAVGFPPNAPHPGMMIPPELQQQMQIAAGALPPEVRAAMEGIQRKIMTQGPGSLTPQEQQQLMAARQMLMINLQTLGAIPTMPPGGPMMNPQMMNPQMMNPQMMNPQNHRPPAMPPQQNGPKPEKKLD